MVRRLARTYLRPYLRQLLIAFIFMLVSASMTALFAKMFQPILDELLVAKKQALIVPLAGAVLVIFVVNGVATYIHTVLMNVVGQAVVADIQQDLFSRFMGFDLKFFHDHPSGQLVAGMISDVQAMRAAMADTLTGFGESFMTLLFLVILMFLQDWQLSLIAICVFPPVAIFVARLGKRLRKISKSIQSEIGGLSGVLTQTLQGMRQVKAYCAEDFERRRFGTVVDRVKEMYFKGFRIGALSTPVNQAILGITFAGVVIYGGHQTVQGHMTAGELMSFIAAFSLAYEPIKKLAKLNNNLQMGLGAAERIFRLMDIEPQITDKAGAKSLKAGVPDIVFENVTFSYGYDEGYALNDVSFTAPAGKVTAFVGSSGSGKTTAINLVPRLYDVSGGRVLVGGEEVRDVSMESLRRHMALVSQDITIFDDTVRANIAYGRATASSAEVEAAARAAAADEFIRQLPQGYGTRLGEHGTRLSGGQRQRIAIARAILRDAPILLLDEATSALDNESERAIQASLEKLQQGRTTLVIAHRLSTVQKADQIIVLDKGRIAETGTHDELLAKSGLYARMYQAGFSE